jgi:hypothetical protein
MRWFARKVAPLDEYVWSLSESRGQVLWAFGFAGLGVLGDQLLLLKARPVI